MQRKHAGNSKVEKAAPALQQSVPVPSQSSKPEDNDDLGRQFLALGFEPRPDDEQFIAVFTGWYEPEERKAINTAQTGALPRRR